MKCIKKFLELPLCIDFNYIFLTGMCIPFFKTNGNNNLVQTLAAGHYCCTKKKVQQAVRLHIVIYTRNSTTYSVIFCYNLDYIWNFQTHSTKKSQNKRIQGYLSTNILSLHTFKMFWNTRIKLYGLFYHYKLGISICMWFKYFLYSEDG